VAGALVLFAVRKFQLLFILLFVGGLQKKNYNL